MTKPNDKSTVKEMKDYIRSNKLKIKLTQKKAELIANLKSTGNWEGSKPATPKPSFNVKNTKVISGKGKLSYLEEVKRMVYNHQYGDTIQQIYIDGEKYDWNGIDIMNGFGTKVGELEDRALLKRWEDGETSKYAIPKVSLKNKGLIMKKKSEFKYKGEKKFDEYKKKREEYEADKKKIEEQYKIFDAKKAPIMKKITKLVKSAKFRTKSSFQDFLYSDIMKGAFYSANNWVGDFGLKKAKEKYLETIDDISTGGSSDMERLEEHLSVLEKFK